MGGDIALNHERIFSNVTVASMEEGEVKKKKRRHSVNDAEFSVNESSMGDTNGSNQSDGDKKKKKKRHKLTDGDVVMSTDTLSKSTEEGLNSGDKKKSKKKSQDASDDTESSNRKSKKNKSIGNSVECGASQNEVVIESQEDVTNKELEEDRRKKKKKSTDTLSKSTEEGLNSGDKKKSKKKSQDASDDTESSNRKSKKNKSIGNSVECGASQNEVVIESQEDVTNKELEEDRRKKKKKKSTDTLSKSTEEGLNSGDKKKSKKKSQDASDDTESSNRKSKKNKSIGNSVECGASQNEVVIESQEDVTNKELEEDRRKKKKKKSTDTLSKSTEEGLNSGDKKKSKKKSQDASDDTESSNRKSKKNKSIGNSVECGASQNEVVIESQEDVTNKELEEDRRKKKKKKKKGRFNADKESMETQGEKKGNVETRVGEDEDLKKKKDKNKKPKSSIKSSEAKGHKEEPRTESRSSKKVSFSDKVEVFESSDNPRDAKKKDGLVRGKRFSKEEDELIKKAINDYIEVHELGDEGLNMVMNCSSHKGMRDCWKEIGLALPWRPYPSVYARAHIVLRRDKMQTWTPEKIKFIHDYYKKHGPNWKALAELLGTYRADVKDAWRRTKLPNKRTGHWSQEEYQKLFDLVNVDLRTKAALEEKNSKHGMLRDNIAWTAISDTLETRINQSCCSKWYEQLSSTMAAEGIWDDVDDYRLVIKLHELDACCIEDVNWDSLLQHRSGDVCRKRWNQMVRHLGENGLKSFAEQVETLYGRYRPDVLEAKEALDSIHAADKLELKEKTQDAENGPRESEWPSASKLGGAHSLT